MGEEVAKLKKTKSFFETLCWYQGTWAKKPAGTSTTTVRGNVPATLLTTHSATGQYASALA